MDEGELDLLEVVASPSRQRILALLEQGVDHPEDLARKLKLRRQGVDKQLLELHHWGLVDRSAILPADGRPRIVYRLSDRGREFLSRARGLVAEFREGVRADMQVRLDMLEDKLASGDLDEEGYLKKRKEVEARYARFLTGTKQA